MGVRLVLDTPGDILWLQHYDFTVSEYILVPLVQQQNLCFFLLF